MGPQKFICGNEAAITAVITTRNASMGPQKFICGNMPLRLIRRLAGPGFNGAAEIHLRKFTGSFAISWAGNQASMGPQKFICGNISASLELRAAELTE